MNEQRRTNTQFQFTPLREGRHADGIGYELKHNISIHAPPRGATPVRSWSTFWHGNFNSRPSARGDRIRRVGEA